MRVDTLPRSAFTGAKLGEIRPTVVLFIATWCGYCRRFLPHYAKWAGEQGGNPGFGIAVADISDDDNDSRWEDLSIAVVPTVIAFRGGREVWRRDGTLGHGLEPADLVACRMAVAGNAQAGGV